MANINTTAIQAPDVTGLIANGNTLGSAIKLSWTKPIHPDLYATEIWMSSSNDRSTATLIATTLDSNYTYFTYSRSSLFFWIRGVSIYGKANGNWYPISSTGGITAKVLDPTFNFSASEASYTGTGSFIQIALMNVSNTPWSKSSNSIICVSGFQVYAAASNVEFQWSTQIDSGTENFLTAYPVMTEKQQNIHISKIFNTKTNSDSTGLYKVRLYWKASSDVTISNVHVYGIDLRVD